MTERQWTKKVAMQAKVKAAKEFAIEDYEPAKASSNLIGRYFDALYKLENDDENGKALIAFKHGFDKYELIRLLESIRVEFDIENEQGE